MSSVPTPFLALAGSVVMGAAAALGAQPSGTATDFPGNGCTYYADANFSGQSGEAGEGAEVPWVGGPWNDRISSIACAPQCALIAYEHIDFGGQSIRFAGNTRFVGPQWNDRISALRVSCRGSGAARGCTVFEHAEYQGQRREVRAREEVRFVGPFWNDRISAVACRPGCSADVYEHAEFAGQSQRFSGETRFVGAPWNDRISSIRVICRPR